MIQELLGGGLGVLGERKISINGGIIQVTPSPSPSSTSSSTTARSCDETKNLRCPRCDSSNTKFCYYNNYNLTQPRHFCKTCRRYWTKGGALRNVPIGGGCRKNRNLNPGIRKAKTTTLPEIRKEGLFGGTGFDPSIVLTSVEPQGSHRLLALLRTSQNPYPKNSMNNDLPLCGSIGLDPSIGWVSNQQRNQTHQHHYGLTLDEATAAHNTAVQEMYQKLILRSSSSNYYRTDHQKHSPVALSNSKANNETPLSSSNEMSATPVAAGPDGGEPGGYWNPPLAWSDVPSTGGAYP